jgi:hypothetical protein
MHSDAPTDQEPQDRPILPRNSYQAADTSCNRKSNFHSARSNRFRAIFRVDGGTEVTYTPPMLRKRWTLGSFGLLALVVLTGFAGQADGFKRERSGETGALKDALEGKEPPPLVVSEWLNLTTPKPPTFKDLKGKVVLIDFWAHW